MRTARPAIPVITISGYATRENALRSFQLGAFDFLPKPFDVEELVGVMRRGLRYAESLAGEAAGAAAGPAPRYFLGHHAWATLDADGTATLGAAESFRRALGRISEVRLPSAGGHLGQARMLARLAGEEEVHRIWSPLSGLIVAVNPRLGSGGALVASDPLGAGWLARIVPADQQAELAALTLRPAEGETGDGGG
jgi:glycine cleavage system H protein